MNHELHIVDDLTELADLGSTLVAGRAAAAVAEHGTFRMAVSGGRTPWAMFDRLGEVTEFPWSDTVLYQVDERIAAATDPDRNLAHLTAAIPAQCTVIEAMP